MINSLLKLSKHERGKALKKLKPETKKHIFDSIYTMTEELGLDKIDDFETRVKMRHELIQRFPDTVFWDYAEYQHFGVDKKDYFGNIKISTHGDFVHYTSDGRLFLSPLKIQGLNNYRSFILDSKPRSRHRAIASTFIPKPNRLINLDFKVLQVNHIDFIKYNNEISNLEWVTVAENERHAANHKNYKETEYFLFKVVIDNGFKGREFILPSYDLWMVNCDTTRIRDRAYNRIRNFWHGMDIFPIQLNELSEEKLGFPEDISALFNKDTRYFNVEYKPIKGTVVHGPHKGLTFSFFGVGEFKKYFDPKSVWRVVTAERPAHLGCKFERVSHKEAIPLHGNLTDAIYADIKNYHRRKKSSP